MHITILVPAVADRRPEKKFKRTTMTIRNAGCGANTKVITLN